MATSSVFRSCTGGIAAAGWASRLQISAGRARPAPPPLHLLLESRPLGLRHPGETRSRALSKRVTLCVPLALGALGRLSGLLLRCGEVRTRRWGVGRCGARQLVPPLARAPLARHLARPAAPRGARRGLPTRSTFPLRPQLAARLDPVVRQRPEPQPFWPLLRQLPWLLRQPTSCQAACPQRARPGCLTWRAYNETGTWCNRSHMLNTASGSSKHLHRNAHKDVQGAGPSKATSNPARRVSVCLY